MSSSPSRPHRHRTVRLAALVVAALVLAGSLALAFFIGYSLAVAQGVQSAVVVGGVIALLVAPLLHVVKLNAPPV